MHNSGFSEDIRVWPAIRAATLLATAILGPFPALHAQPYTQWRLVQPFTNLNAPLSLCGKVDYLITASTICFQDYQSYGLPTSQVLSLVQPAIATSTGGSITVNIKVGSEPTYRYRYSWTFDRDATVVALKQPLVITLKFESLDCTDPNNCRNPFITFSTIGRGVTQAPGENRYYAFNAPPYGLGQTAIKQFTVNLDGYPEAGFDLNLINGTVFGGAVSVSYRYQGETGATGGGGGGGGNAAGFGGQWATNFGTFTGPLSMTVNGNTVTGVYANTDGSFKGAFTCTVSGNVCTGTFADPANSGTLVLTLAGDGQSFTAAWSATNGNKGVWNGTKTATSTCGGTCSLGSPGQGIGAGGGTGSVTVTASSTWTVTPPTDPWIHITSGASGNGNGTVTFTVDPNTGPPRSTTLSIGGQATTIFQNGTPTGVTAGCNYLIQSSTTQTAPVGGGNGLIQIVTGQACGWTAATATSWITLNTGATNVGNGAVSYTTAANNTGNPRSGAVIVAGQYVVVNQAGGVPAGTPSISTGGIVNAASYATGGPPNGLAQGSFFSIFGTSLGPDQPVKASGYPLPTSISGASVQVIQGGTTYNAPLVFTSATQINGIIPSNVPLGNAQVTVTFNGKTGLAAPLLVSKTSTGIFYQAVNGSNRGIAQNVASATDYPLNLPSAPAKPGQIIVLWATGLGPVNGPDNAAPGTNARDMTETPVTITVGGVAAQRNYAGRQSETAGVDNIYFTLPANVPLGCNIPVVISAGGVAANTTTLAISADGSPCQ